MASRYTRDLRQQILIKKPAETLDFVECQAGGIEFIEMTYH